MVLVPVSSLKKALIILQERKNCQNEVLVARDSIKTQSEIISNLDTIVVNQSSMINLLKENNDNYKKVITNKDTEIKHFENLYVKEKRHKKMAIGGGSLLFILSIIFL
jgi:flagellar biosynthesis chaperone FliJ